MTGTTSNDIKVSPVDTLRRLSDALKALVPYWQGGENTPAPIPLTDELADALTSAPLELLAKLDKESPPAEIQKLMLWAREYNEHRKHAQFFELLQQLKEADPNAPGHADLLVQVMHSVPTQYSDVVHEVVQDCLPRPTHVNDQGQPVYSLEQVARYLGKTVEQVKQDMECLIADGLLDAGCVRIGHSYPLH